LDSVKGGGEDGNKRFRRFRRKTSPVRVKNKSTLGLREESVLQKEKKGKWEKKGSASQNSQVTSPNSHAGKLNKNSTEKVHAPGRNMRKTSQTSRKTCVRGKRKRNSKFFYRARNGKHHPLGWVGKTGVQKQKIKLRTIHGYGGEGH